jgi:hypothetical protein
MARVVRRYGFKGKTQLPLFMIWEEELDDDGEIIYARVIFDSMNWIGI